MTDIELELTTTEHHKSFGTYDRKNKKITIYLQGFIFIDFDSFCCRFTDVASHESLHHGISCIIDDDDDMDSEWMYRQSGEEYIVRKMMDNPINFSTLIPYICTDLYINIHQSIEKDYKKKQQIINYLLILMVVYLLFLLYVGLRLAKTFISL